VQARGVVFLHDKAVLRPAFQLAPGFRRLVKAALSVVLLECHNNVMQRFRLFLA